VKFGQLCHVVSLKKTCVFFHSPRLSRFRSILLVHSPCWLQSIKYTFQLEEKAIEVAKRMNIFKQKSFEVEKYPFFKI